MRLPNFMCWFLHSLETKESYVNFIKLLLMLSTYKIQQNEINSAAPQTVVTYAIFYHFQYIYYKAIQFFKFKQLRL